MLVALGIAVVAVVLLVGLTVGPGALDADDVERDVAAQYEEREGTGVELSCPDDMPLESGGVFPCRGTTEHGDEIYVEIQVADPGEDVDYHWWTPE